MPSDIRTSDTSKSSSPVPSLAAFKAYDIRGRVPDELNESLAARIGVELSALLQPGPVVLGRDVRLSSPAIQAAVSDGLRSAGREVIDIGLCGTEEVYFQTDHLGAAGGVMVTASHNPMDYNGLKLVRENARPISGDSGLFTIRDRVLAPDFVPGQGAGGLRAMSDKNAYFEHLLGYVQGVELKPLKIVSNPGNGGAGVVIDGLASKLPFEFIRVHHEPDGNFPHGIPNPLLPESRAATADAVRAHGADLGIAWDGDFDRCFFFDGDGRFIEGYYLVGLPASRAARSSTTRACCGTRWRWCARPAASRCCASRDIPSSRNACARRTPSMAAR